MAISRCRIALKDEIYLSFKWVAVLVLVEIINAFFGHSLNNLGIHPREVIGLPGIVLSPLLHSDYLHLVSNILPLALFAVLVMQHGIVRFWLATFVIVVVGGGMVWLLGRGGAVHIGASGLIFGYFSFLIVAGIRSGDIKLLVIAIAVGFFYGGIIFGVLPREALISWEAHLFGLIAGILAAFWLTGKRA
jgi:membrane associated rhomboid family serine protease